MGKRKHRDRNERHARAARRAERADRSLKRQVDQIAFREYVARLEHATPNPDRQVTTATEAH